MAPGIFRAFKAREGRENGCKGREQMNAERERGQQWLTVADSMFWTKGDPGATERIVRGNMEEWEWTKSRICWGKTEEELEVVIGKSPLCYTFHA